MNDWKDLHDKLRGIARDRIALEAREARYLVEADDTRLYRRLGYTTMVEYMERELAWGMHAANERLRVARELVDLPLTAELFDAGELCFSAIRELTRVVTPETEEAFLRKAQGKTARQIQQMVSGLKRGDDPETPPNPRLVKKRIVVEVSVETYAIWRQLRIAMDADDDDAFVKALCRGATQDDSTERPRVQTATTTCRACKRSAIEAAGEALPIDVETTTRLACDSEDIGDLETDEPSRVTTAVPAAIRRKVFHRDHFACTVPGCRSARYLDLHHVIPRERGGDHAMTNLTVLCFGCHQRHHEGRLRIHGLAPELVFEWCPEAEVERGPTWDWADG